MGWCRSDSKHGRQCEEWAVRLCVSRHTRPVSQRSHGKNRVDDVYADVMRPGKKPLILRFPLELVDSLWDIFKKYCF